MKEGWQGGDDRNIEPGPNHVTLVSETADSKKQYGSGIMANGVKREAPAESSGFDGGEADDKVQVGQALEVPRRRMWRKTGSGADCGDGAHFKEHATGSHTKETGEVSHVSDYDASRGLYGREGKGGGSEKQGKYFTKIP